MDYRSFILIFVITFNLCLWLTILCISNNLRYNLGKHKLLIILYAVLFWNIPTFILTTWASISLCYNNSEPIHKEKIQIYSINNNAFFTVNEEVYNANKIFGRNFKTGESLILLTYSSSYGINWNSKKEKFVLEIE